MSTTLPSMPHRQSLAVGATVLGAAGLLVILILAFGALPRFLNGGYQINIHAPDATGLSSGSKVTLNGVEVGTIDSIKLCEEACAGVVIIATIQDHIELPVNTRAVIREQLLGDMAKLSLLTDNTDGGTNLSTDGTASLTAVRSGLVQEFSEQMDSGPLSQLELLVIELGTTLETINQAAAAVSDTFEARELDSAQGTNLRTVLVRADQTLTRLDLMTADIQTQLDDSDLLANASTAAENLAHASAEARETIAQANETLTSIENDVNTLTTQTGDEVAQTGEAARETMADLRERMARLEERINQTSTRISDAALAYEQLAAAIQNGEGTLGRLAIDPALYENLNASALTLEHTLEAWRALAQRINEEGIPLELE